MQDVLEPAALACPVRGCPATATDDVVVHGRVLFKACAGHAWEIMAVGGRGWVFEQDRPPMSGGQPTLAVYRREGS